MLHELWFHLIIGFWRLTLFLKGDFHADIANPAKCYEFPEESHRVSLQVEDKTISLSIFELFPVHQGLSLIVPSGSLDIPGYPWGPHIRLHGHPWPRYVLHHGAQPGTRRGAAIDELRPRPQHSSLRFDQGSTHALQLPGPGNRTPQESRHNPRTRQKSEQETIRNCWTRVSSSFPIQSPVEWLMMNAFRWKDLQVISSPLGDAILLWDNAYKKSFPPSQSIASWIRVSYIESQKLLSKCKTNTARLGHTQPTHTHTHTPSISKNMRWLNGGCCYDWNRSFFSCPGWP